jgi:hypothetical protein
MGDRILLLKSGSVCRFPQGEQGCRRERYRSQAFDERQKKRLQHPEKAPAILGLLPKNRPEQSSMFRAAASTVAQFANSGGLFRPVPEIEVLVAYFENHNGLF